MLDWTAQEGRFGDLIWTNTLVLPALAAVTIPFVESEGTPCNKKTEDVSQGSSGSNCRRTESCVADGRWLCSPGRNPYAASG